MQTPRPHESHLGQSTLQPLHRGASLEIPRVFPAVTSASSFTFPGRVVVSEKSHAKQLSRSTAPTLLAPDMTNDLIYESASQPGGLLLEDVGASAGSQDTRNISLDEELRDAFEESQENPMRFLPIDALHRIVTPDRVRQKLGTLGVVSTEDADDLTEQIFGTWVPKRTKPLSVTVRQKIFAILVLLKMVPAILDFVSHDVHDEDLPFVFNFFGPSRNTCQVLRSTKGGPSETISLFDSTEWTSRLLESFHRYQWRLLAPYFRLSTNSQPWVLQYNFDDNIVLPMIKTGEDEIRGGGFADVTKAKIHPAHHDRCSVSAPLQIQLQHAD
jgi:hypothetical protein